MKKYIISFGEFQKLNENKEVKDEERDEIEEAISSDDDFSLDDPYYVIEIGGSIGSGSTNTYLGRKPGRVVATFKDHQEAKDYAKRRRAGLSKGEKSYYKMSYSAVPGNRKKLHNVSESVLRESYLDSKFYVIAIKPEKDFSDKATDMWRGDVGKGKAARVVATFDDAKDANEDAKRRRKSINVKDKKVKIAGYDYKVVSGDKNLVESTLTERSKPFLVDMKDGKPVTLPFKRGKIEIVKIVPPSRSSDSGRVIDSKGDVYTATELDVQIVESALIEASMPKKVELSDEIDFSKSHIDKDDFEEFVELLRKGAHDEYEDESKDGFLDLFNYWSERPSRRFKEKKRQNYFKFK